MSKIRTARITTDPAHQDAFIAHLTEHHDVAAACHALGITHETLYSLRRRDAAFAKRWHDAMRVNPGFGKIHEPWTHASGRAFLDAFAETGSAEAAARSLNICVSTAYRARARNARFAEAWYAVRREICERIEGKLLAGALNGFEDVVTADGKERRSVRYHPRIMFEVVAKMQNDPREKGGGRWIQLTPEAGRKARDSLIRKLVAGGGLTTMPEAIEYAAQGTIRMNEAEARAVLELEAVGEVTALPIARRIDAAAEAEPLLLRSL